MTRVEKYRLYREEIANMKVDDSSKKSTVAKRIGEIRSANESTSLSLDNVMDALKNYPGFENQTKTKRIFKLRKDQVLYIVAALLTISLLLALIVLVGNSIWR